MGREGREGGVAAELSKVSGKEDLESQVGSQYVVAQSALCNVQSFASP